MPESQLRRVHHLHLRSSDETLNRRGAILLEDALRTASLPDGGGTRLLLVRFLSLGRFRASAAPGCLAILIEQRVGEYAARAVPAQDPFAPLASAVYFRDDVEPYISLSVRLAKQESVDAWFWPLAVRGWNPGMSRDDSLRVLLASICQTEAAWAGVLSLVHVLLRQGVLSPLLASLHHQDGLALLGVFGWSAPPVAPATASEPRADAQRLAIPADWRNVAAKWIRSWGGEDARSLWFAGVISMLAARENGQAFATLPCAALHQRRSIIETLLAADLRPQSPTTGEVSRQTAVDARSNLELWRQSFDGRDETSKKFGAQAATDTNPSRETRSQSLARRVEASEKRGAKAATGADAGLKSQGQSFDGQDASAPFPSVAVPAIEKRLTFFGGLFYLIAAMQRTGLPDWLQSRPGIVHLDFPALTLRAVARRLRAPEDDPVMMALYCSAEDLSAEVNAAIRTWIIKLRHWCRRVARIGLHSLICRPGMISFTETHIDVMFRAGKADIRVRKAGLDIDPGWTPWFGRVIHFHYLSQDEFDG